MGEIHLTANINSAWFTPPSSSSSPSQRVCSSYATRRGYYSTTVKVALAETFGGFSPDLAALLHEAAELVQDRLVQGEWDVNSWSATRWLPYAAQRVSVALHKAVAYELLGAVGLASLPVCVRVPA